MADPFRCEFCGGSLTAGEKNCPGCGAPNPHYGAEAPASPQFTGKPATIAELQAFCASKGMPLEKMRFFIGTDERSPRCFGIYRDGSDFVVYKNKSDGSRAIRYRGPDEAFAVNELYMKLLEEHRLRNGSGTGGSRFSGGAARGTRKKSKVPVFLIVIAAYLILNFFFTRLGHRNDGYYRVGEDLFYRYGSSWFTDSYGGYDSWTEIDSFPYDDAGSYFQGDSYDSGWGGSDFQSSTIWDDLHDSSSDSDWDSDYDSWDSGDTDWDSDW